LHIAATEGQLECIKILLELNCDTTIKDVRGQTALDLARLWGHRTCAKYLSNDLWNVNLFYHTFILLQSY
jgi:ankyrin repeat domain-containing protein 53